MKKLLTSNALLVTSMLALAACSPAKNDSQVSYKDNGSIINGTLVSADEAIAKVTVGIVGITRNKEGQDTQFKCTGILYSNNVVLTAAHCVPELPPAGKRAAFIVFKTDINQAAKEDIRRVTDFAVHPLWKSKDSDEKTDGTSDMGMLKFEGALPTGYEVGKFLSPDDHDKLTVDTKYIVAGYGRIEDTTDVPNDALRKGLVKIAGLANQKEVVLDQSDRNGVCSGDSGGPIFAEIDGQYYAWGIASRVVNPANPKAYCSQWNIHGLIGTQLEFIEKTMADFSK